MSLSKALTAAAGNAGGGDNLYVEDVFSTYLYAGNGTSQAIENGINLGDANVGGSGFVNGAGDRLTTTESLGSGDFTVEFWAYTLNAGDDAFFDTRTADLSATGLTFTAVNSSNVRLFDSGIRLSVTGVSYLNQWVHFAIERSSGTLTIYVNGTAGGSVANTTNYSDTSFSIGDSPYYGDTDAYISNFRLVKGSAVYGGNFTPPTTPLTAISGTALLTLQSPEPFTDNSGNSLAITQVGNVKAQNFGPFTSADAGAGGLVWIKDRTTAFNHALQDTERWTLANNNILSTNLTVGSQTYTNSITSFNADGFTLGSNSLTNATGPRDFASWTFRKAEKFFDVVTYTGNGVAGRTVAHNLGSTPAVMIIKNLTTNGRNWAIYHGSLGNTKALDFTSGAAFTWTAWNSTSPTDSVFTVSADAEVNANGESFVAYLFASDAGGFGDDGTENIIKCGSWDATGNDEVNLGFEPQWILIKNADGTNNWAIFDTMRGWTADGDIQNLKPNLSSGESSETGVMKVTSTGFTWVPAVSGNTYIYIAIRRPMKTPTAGTEVFDFISRTGTGSAVSVSSPILTDALLTVRPSNVNAKYFFDRPRGGPKYLDTSSSSAEGGSSNAITEFGNDYIKLGGGLGATNGNGSNYLYYLFQRATGFFDVVAYTGDGINARQITHNLKAEPELIISKKRSSPSNWATNDPSQANPWSGALLLNSSNAFTTASTVWNDTAPTDSVFTVGTADAINVSGQTYVAYLFATLAGVSKVGSYTGTGSNVNVDCGFSAGARFVLIKRTSGAGDWYVYDSERGIVAGNDPYLLLNTTAAEVTNTDYIDPLSSGFTVTSSGGNELNDNGSTYIFLAIA